METVTPSPTALHRAHGIAWSVVSRALPGQAVSGDDYVVAPMRDGVVIAVVDGLGHGDEATTAARTAIRVIEQRANDGVMALMQHCHEALRHTRGAAMTVLALTPNDRTAALIGVGNVEMVLVRGDRKAPPARENALLRNGVVGYRLPALQPSTLAVGPGDLLVFATDGVREDFGDVINARDTLPQIVDRILAQKLRGTDDALVLACKVLHDYER